MKNALTITYKDLAQQLAKFGLAARIEDLAREKDERRRFESEFAPDEALLRDELNRQSEFQV
jgi:hypothetical protein